VKSGKST